jgi:hypothetical protein
MSKVSIAKVESDFYIALLQAFDDTGEKPVF